MNKDQMIDAYLEARKQGYDQAADRFQAQIEELTAQLAAYRDAPTIATIVGIESNALERHCLARLSKTITTTTRAADPDRKDEHGNWPGWDEFTLTIVSRPELHCSLCGIRKIYELHHSNWKNIPLHYICTHCKIGSTNIGDRMHYGGRILEDALRAIEEARL
jgi:hypothetical protein